MTDRPAAHDRPPADRPDDAPAAPAPPREATQRWRLTIARDALDGDVAQRALLAAWDAALGGSGLPIAGLDLVPPKPRFAIAAPLSGSIPGEAELVDVWLTVRVPRWRVREAIEPRLPPGHRLVELYDVWLGEAALPGQVWASVYRAELAGDPGREHALRAAVATMLASRTLPRVRRKGDAVIPYDLRPFVEALEVRTGPEAGRIIVRMTLRHDPERGIGRPDEVLGELGDRLAAPIASVALVRERLVLASERPVPRDARPVAGQAVSASTRRGRK